MSNDISQKLNKLKSISRFGKHQYMNMGPDAFVEIFGKGNNAVSFIAVGPLNEFRNITQYLYNHEKRIVTNYTLTTFRKKLSEVIRDLHKQNRNATNNDWKIFIQTLLDIPDETVKVLTPIYGVTMEELFVTLGDFTIYKPSTADKYLKAEFPKASKLIDQHFNFKEEYMIGVTVTAKDLDKCNELANKAFYSFENVSNFITATFHKTNRIGIFNYSSSKKNISFLVSHEKINKSRKTLEYFQNVSIDNPKYTIKENSNNQLWKLITSPKTELEEKILDSIEWCGKALVESDDSKALLQYIISIESLLQYDEGKFISSSIVSLLCDMIAFLLGENYKNRVSYSDYVKELYKIRSSLTHSGKGNITGLNLHTAYVICYKVIRKIVNEEPYKNFQTKKALCNYLSKLKYGNPESV